LKIKLALNFGVDETITIYKPLSMGFVEMALVRNRLEGPDMVGYGCDSPKPLKVSL
jgi:hypothetical protein